MQRPRLLSDIFNITYTLYTNTTSIVEINLSNELNVRDIFKQLKPMTVTFKWSIEDFKSFAWSCGHLEGKWEEVNIS